MEDSIDIILQDKKLHHAYDKPIFMAASGAMLMASYGLWTVFALPGFRKVPISLKVTCQSKVWGNLDSTEQI